MSWQPSPVIDSWRPYSQLPVLAGDFLLLAGSGAGDERPVLQALDRQTGKSRWISSWTDQTDEIEGGLPVLDAQGLIWQGLYARESQFALQAVDLQGQRQGIWTLDDADSDYPIYGCDLNSKLIVAPAFAAGKYIACGWIYRHRQALSYLWDASAACLHQLLEGWPHALTQDTFLLASLDKQLWQAHEPKTGVLRWSLPLAEYQYLGQAPAGWLFAHLAELHLIKPDDGRLINIWKLPGECLDARWHPDRPLVLYRQQHAVAFYDVQTEHSLTLSDSDSGSKMGSFWFPAQVLNDQGLIQAPGQLLQVDLAQATIRQIHLPVEHQQARIDKSRYYALNLTGEAKSLWLRDFDKLYSLSMTDF